MKIVGQGLTDKLEKVKEQYSGVVQSVRYDLQLQSVVCDVKLQDGRDVVLPYKAGVAPGKRVALVGNDFFWLP